MNSEGSKQPLGKFAQGLANGWDHIRQRAARALTYFKPHADDAGTGSIRWGLLAGDVRETATEVVVAMEIPGLDKSDMHVAVDGQQLIVSGEKRLDREDRDGNFVVVERAFGSFQRSVPLPVAVQAEKAKARYDNGVLRITLPKQQDASKIVKVVAG